MLRSFSALAALLALLAAAPPPLLATPSVVVYPVENIGNSIDAANSARVGPQLAARIGQGSDVRVIPVSGEVTRKDYASAAARAGADYYVSGYLAALGGGASLILTVVSVRTGVGVYSTTAQVQTLNDVSAVGDLLREAIARHAARTLAPYEALPTAPPVAPSATPSPGRAGHR